MQVDTKDAIEAVVRVKLVSSCQNLGGLNNAIVIVDAIGKHDAESIAKVINQLPDHKQRDALALVDWCCRLRAKALVADVVVELVNITTPVETTHL